MSAIDRRTMLLGSCISAFVADLYRERDTARAEEVGSATCDAVKPKLKVGQIGVGHAHASKLSVYRASSDYEVVGIVEPNAELRQKAESLPVYRDLPWMSQEQLLNVSGLDVVLVETRVRDLLATAHACVAAGKHIHLDKPAGESFPRYRDLLKLAAEKQRMVQMGYMFRYNPGVRLMRQLLKDGWLGSPFEVHTVMSKVVGANDRRALGEYPGGIMFELGCHVIDLVIGALGRPESITAFPQKVQPNDGLIDNMLAVFQYPKALASVKSSAMEVEGFERRHFVLCGTEGTIEIEPLDNPSVRLALSQKRGDYQAAYQSIKLPKFTRYEGDAADMAKVVRGEKPCDFNYDHDLAVQESVLLASNLKLTS